MLKLVFSEYDINSIFVSNKKILKHYRRSMKKYSKKIENAANSVYTQFLEDSKNILCRNFYITKADIVSKFYSLIKKSIFIDASNSLFDRREYNLTKSIIRILNNENLMLSYISKHQNFLYYYYSLIIFQGKIDKRLLDIFEDLYLQ